MKTILFVDDEAQILKSFRRSFVDSPYTIFLAASGAEALDILSREPVDLIISDIRMPEMDGFSLLAEVKKQYPKVIRSVLSGYADEKIIFKAVSQNLSKIYMYKPWQSEELMAHIEHIFKTQEQLNEIQITQSIILLEDLKAQSQVYFKLCDLLANEASVEAITEVIETDLAIASRILRIANSAYYGAHTASLKQAIVYLGLRHIREIVLTCTIFEKPKSSPEHEAIRNQLWQHAMETNHIIGLLYKHVFKTKIPEEMLTAGLLHDIGHVIMLDQQPEDFKTLVPLLCAETIQEALAKERDLYKITHAELGGLMMDWWDYPMILLNLILHHHNPRAIHAITGNMVYILHIADQLSHNKNNLPIEQIIEVDLLNQLDVTYDQLYHVQSLIKPV